MNLILKDLRLEYKNKVVLASIFLFVVTTVFITYKLMNSVDARIWNALYWIIFLFAALNALIRSFNQENSKRNLYYYSLASPVEIIISKILYNCLVLTVISFLLLFVLGFFLENPVKDYLEFSTAIILGAIGISTAFTFVASIASADNNGSTLMAILALPIILPILLILIKLTSNALRIIQDSSINTDIIMLVGIDLLLFGICIILFPFIWRA